MIANSRIIHNVDTLDQRVIQQVKSRVFSFMLFKRFKTQLAQAVQRTTQKTPLIGNPLEANCQETYQVVRRASGDLPVYTDIKSNKTRTWTLIRHVLGRKEDLVQDLSQFIPPERISIKPSMVVINGNYALAVRQWLSLYFK